MVVKDKEIIVATRDIRKIRIYKKYLKTYKVLSLDDIGWEGDFDTRNLSYEQAVLIPAFTIAQKLNKMVVADVEGFEVLALGLKPGTESHYYLGENVKQEDRNQNIIDELNKIDQETPINRNCRFIHKIALAVPGIPCKMFEAHLYGTVPTKSYGFAGLGYESICIPEFLNTTLAMLEPKLKGQICHYDLAVKKLWKYLDVYLDDDIRRQQRI